MSYNFSKMHISFPCKDKNKLKGKKLQNKINQLQTLYLPMDLNAAYCGNKAKSIDELNYILKHCNRQNLQRSDFKELLICALTTIYYFGMRLKLSRSPSKCWYWCGKRKFHKAESVFQKTLDMLLPKCSEVTIKITLKFFTDVSLWPFENFVTQILEVILYFIRGRTALFHLMLTDIHLVVLFNDVISARHRMRVLYSLLNSSHWMIDKCKLLPFVTRLLEFFADSISKRESKISVLQKGFDVCLRRIFERVDNQQRLMIITTMLNWLGLVHVGHEEVVQFSVLLYHAVDVYKVGMYEDSLYEGLIEHVLSRLIGSTNIAYSVLGCRLLFKFLDRNKNSKYLSDPTIFYDISQVPVKVGECDNNDRNFIRQYRGKIHHFLMNGILFHGSKITYLKHVYAIICAIVVEVPCSLTAAAAACLLMQIQDMALNVKTIPISSKYCLHALVVSVMSLICWVHKSPVLYMYVNQIISRRAQKAPYLNPPMMDHYTVDEKHVIWDIPTLFFEDWELRYALWKHFHEALKLQKLKNKMSKVNRKQLLKKVPKVDFLS